jgi:hypothetical protein
MIVKNCFGQDIDLRKYSKIILREASGDLGGKRTNYVVGAESDPVCIYEGRPVTNQVMLDQFDDYEAAKRAKLKYESCLQNISLTDR